MRALPHWLLLTPKPAGLPPMPPRILPLFALWLLVANCFAVLDDAVLAAPAAAGEATRGYLHGGLLIDFVGERGPVSKWRLVALDALVVALEMVMMGLELERRRLKKRIGGGGQERSRGEETRQEQDPNVESRDTQEERQDIEAEERGVRRSHEEIELQRLDLASEGNQDGSQERDALRDEEEDAGAVEPGKRVRQQIEALQSARTLVADVDLRTVFSTLKLMHYDLIAI